MTARAVMSAPDATSEIDLPTRYDLLRTLAPLAHGRGDPTIRLSPWRSALALWSAGGPASLEVTVLDARHARVAAWGRGAGPAVDWASDLLGLNDRPDALIAKHSIIGQLQRRLAGVRLPRTGRIWAALVPAVLEQKVTGDEARRTYRALIRRHGQPAPGPLGVWLPPEPTSIAELPYHAFHPLGLERRRAEVLRLAARYAARLEAAPDSESARRLLAALPGIGPWTVAEVLRVAHGDPDAVSIGDYHIPGLVGWVLAGERHADDARMLELLEPYRGQRGRVQRLLELSGLGPPRRGPRMASRHIAAL